MSHNKGIPMGYISRTYDRHPVFPCIYNFIPEEAIDILVNDKPAPCPFNPLYDLPRNHYRYIVFHKPQPEYFDYKPGTPGEAETAEFINLYLSQETPIIDDSLTVVYQMPDEPDLSALPTTLGLGDNWHAQETAGDSSWRWAESPAELIISSPAIQNVVLEIMISSVYIPPARGENDPSRLYLEMGTDFQTMIEIEAGKLTEIALELSPGKQSLFLNLEAGNFQPSAQGNGDTRHLSFAVHYLNLRTNP
jgi:hypothetical protein